METKRTPMKIFYSCSDSENDAPFLEQLEKHIRVLQSEGLIATWHERQIVPGSVRQVEVKSHLNAADLILLLVSSDFLASDYCYGTEMPRALQRHAANEAKVIPILLRPCAWQSALFAPLEMLPTGGRPITQWHDHDAAWTDVVMGIRQALREKPAAGGQDARSIWNVPYSSNRLFTGREELLKRLHTLLDANRTVALKGMGGIGKTQIAIEYACRSREQGRYTHTLWINAADEARMIASFLDIANKLFPSALYQETDQRTIVESVKDWLERCKDRWLLIFDNADDVMGAEMQVQQYFPHTGNGNIILTTRDQAVGSLATPIKVETMSLLEGTHLLLRRAQRFENVSDDGIKQAGTIVVALDHFPLALDQAGAYLEETGCSFAGYLDLYRQHRQLILAQRGRHVTSYPDSVANTWSLSFQKVGDDNPAAAELLKLCAFLAPDFIPEELVTAGAAHWPGDLQKAATNSFAFDQMIGDLYRFSLIKRFEDDRALSIHLLVQAVQQDRMSKEEKQQWAERVVSGVRTALPPAQPERWPDWKRMMPQIQLCARHIKDYKMHWSAAIDLLGETGLFLVKHAQYQEANTWYRNYLDMLQESHHPDSLLLHAMVLINLGNVYSETAGYPEAEQRYQESLHIFTREKELDRREFARLLNNMAILSKVQNRPQESEERYIRSLTLQLGSCVSSRETKKKPSTLDSQDIATLSSVLNKSPARIQRYLRCLFHKQTAPCPFALVLNNLAVLFAEQFHQRYEAAQSLLNLSLYLQKQHLEHDSADEEYDPRQQHSDYALSLHNLANLYTVWGSNPEEGQHYYEEALSLYRESEERLTERYYDIDHPDLAYPLLGQGILHFEQGRYEEAEECYQRSRAIWEKLLLYHPQVGYAYYNLANLYVRWKGPAAAKEYYQKSLATWKDYLGTDHLHTKTCSNKIHRFYDNPKGESEVQKAELIVLPTYRSFRLYSSQTRS